MTETLCTRLIAALEEHGIRAFPEFPERLLPIPENRCFVTVSAEQYETGEPVLLPEQGAAVPVSIRLRVRSHAYTWESIRAVTAQAEHCMQAVFDEMNLDVRRTVRGEITYQKTPDRLEQECLVMIHGMLYREEEDDAD
ncbi:MAG: hypothetical protein J5722_05460 [Oscillospiraceae bacterium]|nr:hypothetical protein [Oscillospiraceae bacterium]